MDFKIILVGILTAVFILVYNARWLLRHPLPYLWRALLVGAGVSVAITFAQKSIQIFLESEPAPTKTNENATAKKALTQEKIIDGKLPESEEEELSDSEKTGDDPDQAPMASIDEGEDIDEEGAEQLADVIKGTIAEE